MAAPLGTIPPGFRFYKEQIRDVAQTYGLDPALIAAICWQESSFCANAYRFEPNFWNRYLKQNAKYRHLNPARVSASYGLMQIMFPLVHEDRLASNDDWAPEHLFEPEPNLHTGCAWFKGLLEWAHAKTEDRQLALKAAIASYNGGRGGNDPSKDNPLRTARYASEVMAKWAVMSKQYAG
jgi:soluble lytic murein transglycosylase-like protein